MSTSSGCRWTVLTVLLLGCARPKLAPPLQWVSQGPGPATDGQVENIKDGEVIGAVEAVAVHPEKPGEVYAGSVNGGIWKSADAMAPHPHWVNQTASQKSLSIGALEYDPTDPTRQTLLAGIGRFSTFGVGGDLTGVLRTTDGGATWTPLDGGGALTGLNISGVAPRGGTLVISVLSFDLRAAGIWRSTDTGAAWTRISGKPGTGLPSGRSFGLAGDPRNPARLFTNAAVAGIYRSGDTGATWTKVSDAAVDKALAGNSRVEISVGTADNVYVAIVDQNHVLSAVFRSGDGGGRWTAMDLPPDLTPGRSGNLHLSLAADPSNPNLVYIGGDRQPGPLPNGIGATVFSGRLFRGDASKPPKSQWVHLTNSSHLGPPGGGTLNNSSPHADSRDMAIAANGTLVETSDGGIYLRTKPQSNRGDWFSMNGNLRVTELYSVAWDAHANVLLTGAQDVSNPEQASTSKARWRSIFGLGDGASVAIDDTTYPNVSSRYSSASNLQIFVRRLCNARNFCFLTAIPQLKVIGGGSALVPSGITPIELNAADATRLIIGGAKSVYESLDQANTIREIGPGIGVNATGRQPVAYGAEGNPDVLYVGSKNKVFVRTGPFPAPLSESTTYPGRKVPEPSGTVAGIVLNPKDPKTAYVIDSLNVYQTTDSGAGWKTLTGNLPGLAPGTLRSIAYSTATADGAVIVGTDKSVFAARGQTGFSTWSRLGTGLPAVPVFSLEYDAADGVLAAATLGRGGWILHLGPASPF